MAARGRQQLKEQEQLEACDHASTRTPSPAQEEHHSWDVDTEMTISRTSTCVQMDAGSSDDTKGTSFTATRATIRGLGTSVTEDALSTVPKLHSTSNDVHTSTTVTIPAALAPKELHRCSALAAPAAHTATSVAVQPYSSVRAHVHHAGKECATPFTETLLAARAHEFDLPDIQTTRVQDNVPIKMPSQKRMSEAATSKRQDDIRKHGAFVKSQYRILGNVSDESDIVCMVLDGEAPTHRLRTQDSTPGHVESLDVLGAKCNIPALTGPKGFCHMVSMHSEVGPYLVSGSSPTDVPRSQEQQVVRMPSEPPRASFCTRFRNEFNLAGEFEYF